MLTILDPLTRHGRIAAAAKHCKALRRYQQDLLAGRTRTAADHFEFLGVRPLAHGYQWAPRSQLMMPMAIIVRPSTRHGTSLAGGSNDFDGEVITRWIAADATGTDNGQSENAPWTMTQAMAASTGLTAGHIGGVQPGTYTGTNTSAKELPAWRMANSGTALSPIAIVARRLCVYNASDRSIMTHDGSTEGDGCPSFGINGQDYNRWKGFYTNEVDSPTSTDTGPVVIWDTTGSVVEHCIVEGDSTYRPFDNHCGVRFERAASCRLSNTIITGFYSGANARNGCAVEVYFSGDLTIDHCDISDCSTGVFYKDTRNVSSPSTGNIVTRLCHIHDLTFAAFIAHRKQDTSSRHEFSRNLVVNCAEAAEIFRFPDASDPKNIDIVNNVFYNCTKGYTAKESMASGAGHRFWNNIVAGCTTALGRIDGTGSLGYTDTSIFDAEHNCYHGFTTFCDTASGAISFSTWQGTHSQDSTSPAAQNSDPLFVNAAGLNFRLQGGSPAIDLGVDVLNMAGGGTSATIDAGIYVLGTEEPGVEAE